MEDTSDRGLADFQEIYEEAAARQGMEAKPPDYFETLLSLTSSTHYGALFFAEFEGVPLATALVLYFGPRATYFYCGSRTLSRQVIHLVPTLDVVFDASAYDPYMAIENSPES